MHWVAYTISLRPHKALDNEVIFDNDNSKVNRKGM